LKGVWWEDQGGIEEEERGRRKRGRNGGAQWVGRRRSEKGMKEAFSLHNSSDLDPLNFLAKLDAALYYTMPFSQGTTDFPSQIEVTLITARSPPHLRTLVEGSADHLDLVHLRKISAVSLITPEGSNGAVGHEGGGECAMEGASAMDTSISDLGKNLAANSPGVEALVEHM
jgi:hypothetical protein